MLLGPLGGFFQPGGSFVVDRWPAGSRSKFDRTWIYYSNTRYNPDRTRYVCCLRRVLAVEDRSGGLETKKKQINCAARLQMSLSYSLTRGLLL
jgi:hypothetical protein